MGQSIVLAVPKAWDFASLAECLDLKDLDKVYAISGDSNYLRISTPTGGWAQTDNPADKDLNHDNDYRVDYETNDYLCKDFRKDVAGLRFFSFRFNDISLMRRVLVCVMRQTVAHNEIGWIDTDYGWVVSAREFLHKVEQEPNWDWRTSPEEDQIEE